MNSSHFFFGLHRLFAALACWIKGNRSQVQACPGLRLVAYASESATALNMLE